ncbi:peptidase M48 [Desulfuromonas soudanensis]|uniref:Peptidase M48 n=2 Tax=Desulfuromonas soudanensis TaxID=1603606 RepID=A0A0M5IRW0_9BACT|nr:peptidase M48 [Desulfuromonas soudanensis]
MIPILLLYLLTLACRLLLRTLNLRHLARHGEIVPPGFEKAIDGQLLSRSCAYTGALSRLGLWQMLGGNLVLLAFLFGGGLVLYDRWIGDFVPSFVGGGVVFFLGLQLSATVFTLPFSFYRTFVIEERYGFNATTPRLWLADLLKSSLISAVILSLMTAAALALVAGSPQLWWLAVWVLFTLTSLFLILFSPVLIEPLFFKFEPVGREPLRTKIEGLTGRAGLRVSRVLQVDASRRSRHSNAYFTGIGRVKRIVLYDTLLEEMNDDEILAILAHEAGHWTLGHIRNRLLWSGLLSLAVCYGSFLLLGWKGLPGLLGLEQASFFARVVILAFVARLGAFFLTPAQSYLSRRHERQADDYAAALSGKPEALASALVKLSRNNLANLHPHPLYSAFYDSHPPVVQRVAQLDAAARGHRAPRKTKGRK